ncbi:winged helix-turn-helix transcriptional regulator [Halorutilales archaeon Cl-col2-1]
MTSTRSTIQSHIAENPGVYFSQIVRSLDLAPGQVQHHLRSLREDDDVIEDSIRGYTHYYPETYDGWERETLAFLRRETVRDILFVIIEEEPNANPVDITDELGIARSTLEWHLDSLVDRDIVEKNREMGGGVGLSLSHPERTHELLEEVSPSLSDRLTDRFIRAFDQI